VGTRRINPERSLSGFAIFKFCMLIDVYAVRSLYNRF
jgi:hypothetical protein